MENPITVTEILETLSQEEKDEVSLPEFLTPLGYYLEGYNTNAKTSAVVRDEAITKIRTMAKKRVAVRNEIKTNPDILKTRADDPLIIIGLHRSGTTMLNRLLSSDPQFFAPMLWEMLEPIPAGRPQKWRDSAKFLAAYKQYQNHTYKVDESKVEAIHVYELELQEECMLILMDHFLELPEVQYVKSMDKLRDFVYNCPKEHVRRAYEYYKQCLQCISYGSDKRILMKSGLHLFYMDVIKEVFPNAKFVLILRNGKEIIPSLASLASQHGADKGFTDDELGKRMAEYFGLASSKAVEFVKTTPKESFYAIGYRELVKDPLAEVKAIYSHFNLNLAPEAEELLKRHMVENKQNKHGKHKYGLQDFGLTVDDIKNYLKDYQEFFKDKEELAL